MTDWKSTAEIATRQAESLQASNGILRAEILSLTQAHAVEVSQLHQEIDYLGRARDEISSGRMDSALMEIARGEITQAVCKERDQADTTIAELRKGLEQIALDLSWAGVVSPSHHAIGWIGDIERKTRALIATLDVPGKGGE